MLRRSLYIFFFLFVPIFSESVKRDNKVNFLFYGGKYTETDLLPILFSQKTDYRDSYIGVLGLNYPLLYKIRFLDFEAEALFGKHFGIMNHWESDILMLARISNLFYLPMSFAFGEGVSLTSQNPTMENKRKGFYLDTGLFQFQAIESRNFLNYVMVELDYRVWDTSYNPRIFVRIHHRSGVFGLLCPPDPACGSNFISYGVKFSY
ncbi:MAG: hypothetical protein KBA66_20680 [Leptospiraceae bacterium]|nr:hypothetical protein [Leptospiraceae bacterium]